MSNSLSEQETATSAAAAVCRKELPLKKKLLFIATMLGMFLVLLALVIEVMLRLFAPQPLIPRYVTDSGFGIRVHSANISIHHTTPDYRIAIRTNGLGIRADREFEREKPKGTVRIVGIGDSFTFGYGVEVEDTYLARLAGLLKDHEVNAEVINLGVSGHGTAEQLIMLKERGLQFAPDLVIIGYFANDITDNVRSGLYGIDDAGSLIRKKEKYLPAIAIRDWLYSFAAYRFLAERSHLLYLVRRNISEFAQTRMYKKSLGADAPRSDRPDRLTTPLVDETRLSWRLTAALLEEIQRTCDERGISLCVVDIPRSNNDSNLPREYLQSITDSDIVDLRGEFQEHMQAGKKLYWTRSDGHWTPLGHQIAAEAIDRWIQENGLDRPLFRNHR